MRDNRPASIPFAADGLGELGELVLRWEGDLRLNVQVHSRDDRVLELV